MKLLADFLGASLSTFTLFYFYTSFLRNKRVSSQTIFIFYFVNAILFFIYLSFAQIPIQRVICSIILILCPLILYKGKLLYKITLSIIYFSALGISELLIKAILLGYSGGFSAFYESYEYNYFLGVLFSKILSFILLYLLTILLKIQEGKVPLHLFSLLLVVPTLSIVTFYFLQEIVYKINTTEIYILHCYITFLLLLFNLIVFFLFSQATESSWLKAKLRFEKQITKNQQQYYESLTNYQEKIRQLYHDVHNHFLLIHQMLSKDDSVAALQYLEHQLDYLEKNKTTFTSYLLLDTIFDYKQQLAVQQKTKYTVYSELMPNLPLNEQFLTDLALIIASCIDNSLEATIKIPDPEKRWIKIKISNDDVYFYCQIENSVYENITIIDSQIPNTTKSNQLLHGLGLRNTKRIVEQYQGDLYLMCKDYKFTAALMLKY